MKFLIEWKESGEQEIHRFGIMEEGAIEPTAQQLEDEDDSVFFWLTTQEALAIGADYDGGDWFVIRCACDECEIEHEEDKEICLICNENKEDNGLILCSKCNEREGK